MSKQVALLGTAIDAVTMVETLSLIESFIADGGSHQIATANTDFLVKALHDIELRTVLAHCDLVVADGMPVLWASRMMGTPMPERVTGADLVPKLGELSGPKGWRLFLLGGTPDASRRAEETLKKRYPTCIIAGRLSPPVATLGQMDDATIMAEIHRARPDILLVAFGNPKQEKWIHRHLNELRVPVCIGVGAALDFLGGTVPRAPRWMQSTGFEWLHRMITEPRRLGRRYVVDAFEFGRYLGMQLFANGLMSLRAAPFVIVEHNFAGKTVLQVKGRLFQAQVSRFTEECRRVLKPGRTVIIDFSATSAMSAEALAALMNFRKRAKRQQGHLILTGLTTRLQRTLRLSQASSQFYTVSEVLEALSGPSASGARAQIRLEFDEESVACQIEGEIPGIHLEAVAEVCDQLSRSFSQVSIDTVGLNERSRTLLADLKPSSEGKSRAASAA